MVKPDKSSAAWVTLESHILLPFTVLRQFSIPFGWTVQFCFKTLYAAPVLRNMCGLTSVVPTNSTSSTLTGSVGPAIQGLDVKSFIAKYFTWVSCFSACAGGTK